MRDRRDLGTGIGWNLVAEGLALPTGLVTAVFLARVLGPTAYGLFALAVAFITVLEWSLAALFSRAVIKVVGDTEEWQPVAAAAIRLHLQVGAALAGLLFVMAGPLATLFGEPSLAGHFRWWSLELPVFALLSATRNIQAGIGDFRARAIAGGVRWIARLVLVVTFVSSGLAIPGAIAGSIGSVIVGCAIAQRGLRLPWWRVHGVSSNGLWTLALPLFALSLTLRLYDRLGLFVLKALGAPTAEAGFYAAAQNLAGAPIMVAQTVAPLVLARMTQALRRGNRDEAREVAGWTIELVVWLVPIAAFLAGAASDVMVFVYGPPFAQGSEAAAWLMIASVGSVAVTLATSVMVASNRGRLALSLTAPLSLLALGGFFLVLPSQGGPGAAVVTAVVASGGGLAAALVVAHLWHLRVEAMGLAAILLSAGLSFWIGLGWHTSGVLVLVKSALVSAPIVAVYWWRGGFSGLSTVVRARHMAGPAASEPFQSDGRAWNDLLERFAQTPHHMDRFLADLKRDAYLKLLERWDSTRSAVRILKTDLFEEAVGPDAFFDRLASPNRLLVGIDVSTDAAFRAQQRFPSAHIRTTAADVRQLPFADGTFDLVISPSTLDHFTSTTEIDRGLAELARVVRPGGSIVVTLDNPRNITDPLLRLAERAGLLPFPLGVTYDIEALSAVLSRLHLDVVGTTAIVHHPRLAGVALVRVVRTVRSRTLQRVACRLIVALQRLQDSRWQYRSGCFVAACAVKRTL